LEVKYFIEREDLWKGAKFISKRQTTRKRILITLAVFLLLNIFFLVREEYPMFFIEIIFLAVYLPIVFYTRMRMKRLIMNYPKENTGILGEHKILLLENGFNESTTVNDSFHSWKGVSRIDSNDEYIFIVIDNPHVHLIPKRNFNSLDDALKFEETMKDLFDKHH
jgi:hypothetical protein